MFFKEIRNICGKFVNSLEISNFIYRVCKWFIKYNRLLFKKVILF